MTENPALNRAILQILLQVAWADHEISESEVKHILDLASTAKLSDTEIEEIRACLSGDAPLPIPDLGLLKQHRKQVLLAVGSLIAADDAIVGDDQEAFEQIKEMLE